MAYSNSPHSSEPRVTPELFVGVASPLWSYFGAAAAGGVAFWWMTRWTQPVNLEALFDRALRAARPAPPLKLVTAAEAAVETVVEAVAEIPAALVAALPEPTVEAEAPTTAETATIPEPPSVPELEPAPRLAAAPEPAAALEPVPEPSAEAIADAAPAKPKVKKPLSAGEG